MYKNHTEEEARIIMLEFLGWTDFSRVGRRGTDGPVMALRGTSPAGVKKQVCPNPMSNLDSMREVELKMRQDNPARFTDYLTILSCDGQQGAFMASCKERGDAFLRAHYVYQIIEQPSCP